MRVEVLAKNLGVTKGGFYRRFKGSRRAARGHADALARWPHRRDREADRRLDGASARERLKAIITLYSERMNTEAMAVELAIRQWARTDEAAAAAAASVDAARLKNVGQLYRATGLPTEEADAQAFLFYCFIFGQSPAVSRTRPAQARAIAGAIGGKEKLLDDGHWQWRVRGAASSSPAARPSGDHLTVLRCP